jgi:ribose 5-phosphate isomerase RpiB
MSECGFRVEPVFKRALAWELVQAFLAARFSGAERYRGRLAKAARLESGEVRT